MSGSRAIGKLSRSSAKFDIVLSKRGAAVKTSTHPANTKAGRNDPRNQCTLPNEQVVHASHDAHFVIDTDICVLYGDGELWVPVRGNLILSALLEKAMPERLVHGAVQHSQNAESGKPQFWLLCNREGLAPVIACSWPGTRTPTWPAWNLPEPWTAAIYAELRQELEALWGEPFVTHTGSDGIAPAGLSEPEVLPAGATA